MGIFTDSILFDLINIIATLFVLLYGFFKWKYAYWQRIGVPDLEDSIIIPYGNSKDTFLRKKAFGQEFQQYYHIFKSKKLPYGGVFMGINPFFIPIDPELIKNILQKDFEYFSSHGIYYDEELEPLTGHLFNLDGPKWKKLREKLTPTFTSGKMKMMYPTLVNCAVELKAVMDDAAESKIPVDIKDILGRFTTDIIGSCAFGIECNTLKNPTAEFRKYGKKIFEATPAMRMKFILSAMLPVKILNFLKIKFLHPEMEQFFTKVVEDIVNYREKNNIFRKDFMHLLLQLKNRGKVTDDEHVVKEGEEKGEHQINMDELAAQAFVFFAAGFETSSTTMTWALYEIALNPEIQDKMREEINTVLKKHNGELTYDAIMEMHYMQRVLDETLRLHSPFPNLPRKCTKDYKIPNTDVVIEKGTRVTISIMGIHTDPEYYPNPEKFDPDRFTEENKAKRPHFTWLPFGDGPRLCIGLRFGVMQSKVGLVTLLKNYKITLNKKTKVPVQQDKNGFIASAEGGIWLDLTKVDN